jgi:4-diphosphocytidyl-2-C-methyl-D-erythritol kinase
VTRAGSRVPGVAARVVAQAKINLSLRILAREPSGYHQLETLYCRVALGDELTVRVDTADRTLDVDGDAMPQEGLGPTDQNLAWRAASAFADAAGWPAGFSIRVDKRIPVGGGLGGGSADAGAVLRALNHLAPEPLSPERLVEIGGSLGSDVPFLTQDASPFALGWGRGARLLTLPALPSRQVMLFVFGHGVSTKDAYGWLARTPVPLPGAALMRWDALSNWREVATFAHNDLESVVQPRFRLIEMTLAAARKGIQGGHFGPDAMALMSGSGASVFLVVGEPPEGEANWMVPLSAGVKLHWTATAERVEPVEVIE